MATNKPHMNLVFIGHVDHGKSTTVGRILFEKGVISDQVIKKFEEEATKSGKQTFKFAWVMDAMKEERERGLTIDIAHRRFDSDKYYFTIIDAPGHRDFVKNMITGTSQADAAVLVVAANDGVMAQTKEHAWLARTLGIQQLIIALNKMDTVNFDEKKFEERKKEVQELLKPIGYKVDEVPVVPIASFATAENLSEKAGEKMGWYKGPTLLEAIDLLKEPQKATDKPLRLPLQDVYSITGVGTVPVGRIETGVLKSGMKIAFEPAGATAEVKSVEMHHEQVPEAQPGDNVGFNVRGVGKDDIRRGDVAGPVDNPPTVVDEFTAQIVVLNHPSAITVGYTPVFHAHTTQCACTVTEIVKKMDPQTGEAKEENPDFLKTGDAAIVKLKPVQPLVLEKAADFPPLGRFAVRDSGATVAAGVVQDIVPKKK
ncbi:translation elongation factor EF-1 subunit alpha [Candidatus Undinarchaeota archaeon]